MLSNAEKQQRHRDLKERAIRELEQLSGITLKDLMKLIRKEVRICEEEREAEDAAADADRAGAGESQEPITRTLRAG